MTPSRPRIAFLRITEDTVISHRSYLTLARSIAVSSESPCTITGTSAHARLRSA